MFSLFPIFIELELIQLFPRKVNLTAAAAAAAKCELLVIMMLRRLLSHSYYLATIWWGYKVKY